MLKDFATITIRPVLGSRDVYDISMCTYGAQIRLFHGSIPIFSPAGCALSRVGNVNLASGYAWLGIMGPNVVPMVGDPSCVCVGAPDFP